MVDNYMPAYVIDPSMLQLKDYFRKEGVHFDPEQAYGKINPKLPLFLTYVSESW